MSYKELTHHEPHGFHKGRNEKRGSRDHSGDRRTNEDVSHIINSRATAGLNNGEQSRLTQKGDHATYTDEDQHLYGRRNTAYEIWKHDGDK